LGQIASTGFIGKKGFKIAVGFEENGCQSDVKDYAGSSYDSYS